MLEKANTEQDNHFSSSKSQNVIENGYKKAGKAQAYKEKAREMKSYRIMSKTNTISAPSLRHKNSLAASLTSAQLGQSRELAVNSDTESKNIDYCEGFLIIIRCHSRCSREYDGVSDPLSSQNQAYREKIPRLSNNKNYDFSNNFCRLKKTKLRLQKVNNYSHMS